MRGKILLLFALILASLSVAHATETFYVSNSGNDGNSGTASQPFLTIQRCAEWVQAGDTCLVRAGVYDERVTPPVGGAPGNPITFKAEGSVRTRGFSLRTGYIRVEGFEITNTPNIWPGYYGIFLQGDGYQIVDNQIHDTIGDGIFFYKTSPYANRSLITGNVIYRADGTGITIFGQDNIVERNDISHTLNTSGGDADGIRFFGERHVIRHNYIHDITEDEAPGAHTDCFQTFDNDHPPTTNTLIEGNQCRNLDHQMVILSAETKRQSSNIRIRNNLFETPADRLINWQLIYVRQVRNVEVIHNTFVRARYRGLYIGSDATGTIVKNNIFYEVPLDYEIESNSLSAFVSDYNLHFPTANPAPGPNSIVGDPLFVNLAASNFHLSASSPAVDEAQNLGVLMDYDGVTRGALPDIGAFEFASAGLTKCAVAVP